MLERTVFFLLAIIGAVGFVQSLRLAQFKKCRLYAVAAINYCFAAAVFACWVVFGRITICLDVLAGGLLCGCIFGTTFFLLLYCLNEMGVGKTVTTINLAQAIPILASIIIWGERPGVLTGAGIVFAGVAIPLILLPKMQNQQRTSVGGVIALAVLFFTQGVVYTTFKWFESLHRPGEKSVLLMGLFAAAALITVIVAIFSKSKPTARDWFGGFVIGGFNVLGNVALLTALALAAANVALPTITALVVVLNALCSMWFWSERYAKRTYLGLALAVIAVLLVNL